MERKLQLIEKEKRASDLIIANYARSLLEASRDPLFTISTKGKITDINEATVKATGVKRTNLIGSDFFEYFTEPKKAQEGYEKIFKNGFVADYPLTIKDHKLTDVLFNGSVYKNEHGKVEGAVAIARDITEQKRIEKELIESKVFAEKAVTIADEAKLNAEIAMQNAENALKAKQQFLSNMSHEIRTPLNAILGFTKVVLKTELTARQKEYLTAIKISGDALIVLVNDILDLAKVDSGKMMFEKTPFKMEVSISAMLHLFEPKIHEKNLQLIKEYDSNIPDVLIGDSVRLHQIIINLVNNAVKFTHQGAITITVKLIHEDTEQVSIEFSVKDTGIGIPTSKLEKIFENFQQASSGTSRLYGGTGLGLAIVKQLVESQGGGIEVESKEGVGSIFTFALHFQKTNELVETEINVNEIRTPGKDIKILVVEDIILNQLLMKTLLDDFGFECDIAGNGKLAIEKVESNSYDIILMDLQMPEMNGFEATEYIRNTLQSQIPIIALTADVTTVDVAKCRSVGMNDYISKPVDDRLLYSKIISFINKTKLDQVISAPPVEKTEVKIERCINLEYLTQRTKSDTSLMSEIIQAYLDQTPPLISEMKINFESKNWKGLYATVHKIIPSFAIIGIHTDYEKMAKNIQDYAKAQQETERIHGLVETLEHVCMQACNELRVELVKFKNAKNG